MKSFSRILFYLKSQKSNIVLYFVFNLLAVLFSITSFTMLAPFLQLLFGKEKLLLVEPKWTLSGTSVTEHIKYIISQVIIHYDNNKVYALAFICIIILLSVFFKNLFTYLGFRVLSPMRNYVMTKLRSDLFDKILELPIGYFTEQRKGDIISRMSNDANEIEFSVMSTLEGLIREPMTVLIVLATLILLSPQLSLFLFILLPATGFVIGRLSKSLKKQSTDAQERYGLLMSILDETLTGLRIIKAFNAEDLIGKRFFTVNDGLGNLRNKMNFRRDMASPVSEFLGVFVLCCILWFGGRLVLSNRADLNAEGFITYIVLFTQIIQPAKNLAGSFSSARKGGAAVARIEEILQAAIVVKEPEAPKYLEQFNHSIEFKNVSFAYNDVTILKNINLTIEKGKTVALVGSSGAGKSTLADLVPRFHDVTEGELLIDGINIKDLSLQSLRNQISIVTQEPILFNDTIASNICLGKQDATQAQIEDAAKVANAYQFILKKEEGFATNIGDRGSKLSGGERQRLTIARAVLKNPPILILDEATSSLDTESERLVQDAINNMMQNRTSIVIAHRLSTIRHADEIIVLSKGEIAERGTHDSLITNGGIYQRLVEMQEVR
jgi:subfamily B ATP-binding cassette protein MsbA